MGRVSKNIAKHSKQMELKTSMAERIKGHCQNVSKIDVENSLCDIKTGNVAGCSWHNC